MIVLLAALLACHECVPASVASRLCFMGHDEVADAIKRLRAATEINERYQAEYALGNALKPPLVPLVLKEIETGPAELRPHFIRALRTCGTTTGAKEPVAALKSLLARFEFKSRIEAAVALKYLQELDGIKAMVLELANPKLSKEDRLTLLTYMYSYYYDGKEVPPALRKVIETEKDKDVRLRALQALGSHKDPDSVALLVKLSDSPDDALRYEALAALIRIGDAEAVEKGLTALEKGKVPLADMYQILFALRQAGGHDVAARLRALLDKTDDVNVRIQVINTLAQLKDQKSIAIMMRLANDKHPSVADAAVTALMELGGKAHLETFRKLLKHETAERRLKAAETLLALDDTSGIAELRKALEEKLVYTRTRAVTALAGYSSPESVEALLFAMSDEDLNVRTQAATGVLNVLSALFPYRKFEAAKVGWDPKADAQVRSDAIAKIREWWDKNKGK